jgi:hypothetical protein
MNVAARPLFDPNVVVTKVANHDNRFPKVEAGAPFTDEWLEIDADFQSAMLEFSEIDESLYAGEVDPGLLARRPVSVIGSALFDNHPERGYVHTAQAIERFLPIPAGERIHMSGSFTAVDDHPRGWMMHSRFEFRREDGGLALIVAPSALMADPDRNTAGPKPKSGPAPTADERRAQLAADGWTQLHAKTCTPERVVGYCGITRNLIHTDPTYAQGFGFRAPITAGNQMIEWHLEAAKMAETGNQFAGSVKLQRPVFWDDALEVMTRTVDGALEIAVIKDDGRIANTGRFKAIP